MSLNKIILEALAKNPLGLKEAVSNILAEKIRVAIEEKIVEVSESDQLDELSKKTLGNYINKAVVSVQDTQDDIARDGTKSSKYKDLSRTRMNRKSGIKTAVKNLTKEDLDEAYQPGDTIIHKGGRVGNQGRSIHHAVFHKMENGNAIVKAKDGTHYTVNPRDIVKKLGEDTDLQELSNKTLGRYIHKATRSSIDIEKSRDKNSKAYEKVSFRDRDLDDAMGDGPEAEKIRSARNASDNEVRFHLAKNDKALQKKKWNRDYGVHTALNKLKD